MLRILGINACQLRLQQLTVRIQQLQTARHAPLITHIGETPRILEVNAPEVERARANGGEGSFLDRMVLTEERIAAMAKDVRAVAESMRSVYGMQRILDEIFARSN